MATGSEERERIIDAAYRCLAASNGGSVSVNDILKAAGLSTRAFYRHFDSKDGLLLAMFRRDSERVLSELQSAAARASTPPEALRVWIEVTLRLTSQAQRRKHVQVMTSEEAQRATGYAVERERFGAAQTAAIAQILHRGREDGSFPLTDPETDAWAIRAVLFQALDEQMRRSASVSAADVAAQVVEFAFRALGAAGGRAPEGTAQKG
ncbi:TetR/AcrR family transcriptional regulator [Streptomyces sp. NPDC007264]|uniref:TetR/AcrR family transcriptional regulator n=1 Tax=Streptomyces sp. NPDC007264 TaxID=3364777 RepID=UPI0036D87695